MAHACQSIRVPSAPVICAILSVKFLLNIVSSLPLLEYLIYLRQTIKTRPHLLLLLCTWLSCDIICNKITGLQNLASVPSFSASTRLCVYCVDGMNASQTKHLIARSQSPAFHSQAFFFLPTGRDIESEALRQLCTNNGEK